jgi:hypothetical protein
MPNLAELYSSSNGDRWYLARDVALGQVFARSSIFRSELALSRAKLALGAFGREKVSA